jgi:hypothetical protein
VAEGPTVADSNGPVSGHTSGTTANWMTVPAAIAASPLLTFPVAWVLYQTPPQFEPLYLLWIWLIVIAPCAAFGFNLSVYRRSVRRRRALAVVGMAICLGSMCFLIWYVNRG